MLLFVIDFDCQFMINNVATNLRKQGFAFFKILITAHQGFIMGLSLLNLTCLNGLILKPPKTQALVWYVLFYFSFHKALVKQS